MPQVTVTIVRVLDQLKILKNLSSEDNLWGILSGFTADKSLTLSVNGLKRSSAVPKDH